MARVSARSNYILLALTVVVFLLSGMPKVRLVFGAPIYFVDIIIFALFVSSLSRPGARYSGSAKTLVSVMLAYLVFVVLGELRGAVLYGSFVESSYMLIRFSLAISLAFLIPKLILTLQDLTAIVKGLTVGLLLSGLLAIAYSLPPTRGFASVIFSIGLINPVEVKAGVLDIVEALRGQTLIGTSTFSSGVMAMLWPLLFLGGRLFRRKVAWRLLLGVAIVAAPLGILATYGRTAWLSVILVLGSVILWGEARRRVEVTFWLAAGALVLLQFGGSSFMKFDRIVSKTQMAIEAPMERESERERFLAYVEPFVHVVEYPSFFLAGTGAAQRRSSGNAYRERDTASHAIPAMAYYAYGVGGVVCQFGMLLLAYRIIRRNLTHAQRHLKHMLWMWRSLLGSWFGLLPWWLFAHGLVSQPRGAMVYFLFLGTLLACDQIYRRELRLVYLGTTQSGVGDARLSNLVAR
jgi:hypothetical protein